MTPKDRALMHERLKMSYKRRIRAILQQLQHKPITRRQMNKLIKRLGRIKGDTLTDFDLRVIVRVYLREIGRWLSQYAATLFEFWLRPDAAGGTWSNTTASSPTKTYGGTPMSTNNHLSESARTHITEPLTRWANVYKHYATVHESQDSADFFAKQSPHDRIKCVVLQQRLDTRH